MRSGSRTAGPESPRRDDRVRFRACRDTAGRCGGRRCVASVLHLPAPRVRHLIVVVIAMLLVELVVKVLVLLPEFLVQASVLAPRHPRIARMGRIVLGLQLLVPRSVLASQVAV